MLPSLSQPRIGICRVDQILERRQLMRHLLDRIPRWAAILAVVVAMATVSASPSPASADSFDPAHSADAAAAPTMIFTEWAFILQYPDGNLNALALMTLQGGQLAGSALVASKHCAFRVSGTFSGDAGSSATFAMIWTGRGRCSGETLSLTGDIASDEITGTFTDSSEPDTLDLTGTVLFGAH